MLTRVLPGSYLDCYRYHSNRFQVKCEKCILFVFCFIPACIQIIFNNNLIFSYVCVCRPRKSVSRYQSQVRQLKSPKVFSGV